MARVLGLGFVEVEREGVVAFLLELDAMHVGAPLLAVLRPGTETCSGLSGLYFSLA